MEFLDDADFIKLLDTYTSHMRNEIARLKRDFELQEEAYYLVRRLWQYEKMSNLIHEQSLLLTAQLQDKYPIKVVYSPN